MNLECGKLVEKAEKSVDNFRKTVKKCGICLILCAAMWITTTAEVHAEPEKEIKEPEGLYAQSAVLMDADSGRILFAKNGQEERAMASTTKIMTCILALENGNLDDTVTASARAASQPEVHLGVREGEQIGRAHV